MIGPRSGPMLHQAVSAPALPSDVRVAGLRPHRYAQGHGRTGDASQQVLTEAPFSGALFAFRSKHGQQSTFCIQFTLRDDRLPVASVDGPDHASIAPSPQQGPDLHLHR